jgi:adenosine deaminase
MTSAPKYTEALLRALPKTDLHVHLDGSLRLDTLIELAGEKNVKLPSKTPEGLLDLVFKEKYGDLTEYLHGFKYTCAVMNDEESLERVAYELALDNLAEGVRYIEVRFAPQLHVRPGLGVPQILLAVDRGLKRARSEHEQSDAVQIHGEPPFRYGIIASAMRFFTEGFAPYFSNLISALEGWPMKKVHGAASLSLARSVVQARDRLDIPVVGFDLAGAEAGHPASDHIEAYRYAHRNFLKKTVHAGEAYGPESIFQAITTLYADRIGHGTHLYSIEECEAEDPERFVEQLSEYICDRRITLEVCITSNMQTMPELTDVSQHPFGRMVRDRISVTLCTDNRLVSRTSVTEELAKACDAFDLTRSELRNVIIHGFKRSFYPGNYREKRAYVRQVIDYYDKIMPERGELEGESY